MRKLSISLLAVIVSLLTFSTVTYAWLSLATSNTVENISLSFSGESSLEVSLDGVNYYNELPGNFIQNIFGNNRLIDVSSIDGKTFTTFHDKGREAVKNKEYLQVELYFRSSNTVLNNVYLVNHNKVASYGANNKGTFVVSAGRNWTSNLDFHYGPNNYGYDPIMKSGQTKKFYLSEAIRISFNEQLLDSSDTRSSEELSRKIFDLSKDPSRSFGKDYGAYDYFSIVNGKMPLPTKIPNVVTQLTTLDNAVANNDNSHIVSLDYRNTVDGLRYSYGKVEMSIWIEGWDPDTFDSILSDKVSIGLQFNIGVSN